MIYITGDTHRDFTRFSMSNFPDQKEMTRDDIVIICGDFGGVWDGSSEDRYWLNWLAEKRFTICFCDGNHENFELLATYPVVEFHGGKCHKIRENIYHMMRGEIFDFEGKKFFVFGGAASHDVEGGIFEPEDKAGIRRASYGIKPFRINHISWWKEEEASKEEEQNAIDNLEKYNWEVDYVISHDLPYSIMKYRWHFIEMTETNNFLNWLIDPDGGDLKFTKWYGGHHHIDESIFGKFIINYENLYRIF